MKTQKKKTLIAATAQMTSRDGKVISNLEHASELVEQATRKGAQLILFPEFMSQGYRLTSEIWDSAELFDGPTTNWLCETARKYNIYIGSSFLEAKNGHFLNTFNLASPSGKIAGTVRKRQPSMWEAYFFKGYKSPHFIDTEIGRIGIGICFDNHTFKVASEISASKIDLMLMPHSYCTPTIQTKRITQADIDRLNDLPVKVARLYNNLFRVPVILCNKSGQWDSPVPNTILGVPKNYRFSGRSIIIDSDGTFKSEMGNEEGIGLGQVTIDPTPKKVPSVPKYSRYIYPGPIGREIIRLIEWQGRLKYNFSQVRKQKANSFMK